MNMAPYAIEKPVARSHARAAQSPEKCCGITQRPSTPSAMAALRQIQQPHNMTVLHAGCDHWITLHTTYHRYTATYYTEQKLRANEPTLTTTALVSRNKNQNKVSAKWIRNISALTLKQHETPLFLFLVSFYILVKSCSIFISIEKQSSNSESNEM